jgi:hypothetical protein
LFGFISQYCKLHGLNANLKKEKLITEILTYIQREKKDGGGAAASPPSTPTAADKSEELAGDARGDSPAKRDAPEEPPEGEDAGEVGEDDAPATKKQKR